MDTPYVAIDLEAVVSTQDEARKRHDPGGPPVVVSARHQSGGRGRSGSRWEVADVALAVSVALSSPWPVAQIPLLALLAGLTAHETLSPMRPDLSLKWPNDVLAPEGKVAGVLVEGSGASVVVGLGANLWWANPPAGYATILPERPADNLRTELAAGFAGAMVRRALGTPERWERSGYRAVCSTLGRRVCWEPDGEGVATDIDQLGRLVVLTESGVEVALSSGEISHLRPLG
ncbi:MAG: biotin--[acetyl-CoA-carboxylase] ligase [Acidimicrobiia bacterium]|nr:biotin--[acetyl-CoA-carboxylase] ligase [Acidimicrobiia bacterium]